MIKQQKKQTATRIVGIQITKGEISTLLNVFSSEL